MLFYFKTQFLFSDDFSCYRMTRTNFRFPYADQFVERYEKKTTEFTQFPLSQGGCKSSQVIVRLLLLSTQQQVSTK